MSIITNQDFKNFLNFIENFSLEITLADQASHPSLKNAHRIFLALLTVNSELLSDSNNLQTKFLEIYGEEGKNYLTEVASDCSEFIMCILLGLYRSAGGTLRSAIESYFKAFSANEQPLILKRKSVPDVFNDASTVTFFSSPLGKSTADGLKSEYKKLNAYVHTVSADHMFASQTIGDFPKWSQKNVELIAIFINVLRLFIYGIISTRRDMYDIFDHRNKAIVTEALTKKQRRSALGVDD